MESKSFEFTPKPDWQGCAGFALMPFSLILKKQNGASIIGLITSTNFLLKNLASYHLI